MVFVKNNNFIKNDNEKIQHVDKLGICSLIGALMVTGCVICDIGKSVSVKSVKLWQFNSIPISLRSH